MSMSEQAAADPDVGAQIDQFIEETKKLNGQEVREQEPWNTLVTADAIRHLAYGIGDDNPLWLDKAYARKSIYGARVAPPAYLASVLNPILHGARLPVPLTNLIGEIEFTWYLPILEGDRLSARAVQKDVYASVGTSGRRNASILSEIRYWNQTGKLVGKAGATMVRAYREHEELLLERKPRAYTPQELARIVELHEQERGWRARKIGSAAALTLGASLDEFARGPLTIGDMVCWQAGAGPSYRAGALGYFDVMAAPHNRTINPVTGWPVKSSLQHEDFRLAAARGMPAPFDNGVMRLAQLSPALTNLIGDDCRLGRLKLQIVAPNLYGDATFYHTHVVEKTLSGRWDVVKLKLTGRNQAGELTTTGSADLLFPRERAGLTRPVVLGRAAAAVAAPVQAHVLFERQALAHPEKPAVIDSEATLSFRDLDQQTNRLARWLLEAGVEAGDFVCIYLDRGRHNIVALLGVLKAGGVYVPMDTDYLPERVADMVAQTPIKAIFTHERFAGFFPSPTMKTLVLEKILPALAELEDTAPAVTFAPDALAYVMHTSGSVGTVKSVAVRHAGLVSYVCALQAWLGLDRPHVHLHTAATAFSASTRQTFLPLCLGNTLVIANDAQRKDPLQLFALIQKRGITIWDSVPSVLHYFLNALAALPPAQREALLANELAYLCSTGQAMPWTLPHLWYGDLGQRSVIINLYSQTETAGTVCAYRVDPAALETGGKVPIGYPLADTSVYLLKENGEAAGPGERGEVVVGGDRISDGYLSYPALTQERYLPDPRRLTGSGLMFRTGDLAVGHADGCLEYIGRADDKIKIRGMGVELGDIEWTLEAFPGVTHAAVVAQADDWNDYRLYAFVVPGASATPDVAEIRKYLKEKLPEHLVPIQVQLIPTLPIGPNGKTDKTKLVVIREARARDAVPAATADLTAPLCRLWEELLEIPQVRPTDSFFDLGGHSLLAVQMVMEITKRFDRTVSIVDLTAVATVEKLVALLEGRGATDAERLVVPLRSQGTKPPLFCVPGVGGHLMRHQALARYVGDDQPFYGIQAAGFEGNLEIFGSIESVAAHYIRGMGTVQPKGPYYLCGTCFGGVIAFEMARQLVAGGEEVALLVLVETRAPDRLIPGWMLQLERLESLYGALQQQLRHAGGPAPREVMRTYEELDEGEMEVSAKQATPSQLLKQTLRGARKRYLPAAFAGEVILYKVEDSERYRRRLLDRRVVWKSRVRGEWREYWIPGNHLTMLQEPRVQVLGAKLRGHMEDALRRRRPM